jgi:3-hydroxyacyl-CoA dehydrogenase
MIGADDAEVTQSSDSPGFIANAILMPMLNEAMLVLEKVNPIARFKMVVVDDRESRLPKISIRPSD